ncbi:MAG: hypothetical protein HOJ34_00815 [Kordiimonadaceae bacterium]|nr:hypothetical protein [Kordiimonadaceae bacterium]MBT6035731.1 hypothetical protein [Kordiimonadaceae bacterium]MBT6328297.1 hypothetical protein [Kordiimonadaceae bacterium]MBT7582074.1 hypothetical protein [Kordiimonadaceae bacterium]
MITLLKKAINKIPSHF